MFGQPDAATLRFSPAAPEATTAVARPPAEAAAVGVDYLIEQAGGREAVVRDAARRLPRVFRQANMLELTEAIAITLVELAPVALAQLGDAGPRSLHEAAQQLARAASAPPPLA
jgi:hypothetical protein